MFYFLLFLKVYAQGKNIFIPQKVVYREISSFILVWSILTTLDVH
jgi:hypothetical protein